MIAVDCDYDDGAPITYRGIALQRDGIEIARFAAGGFEDDLSAAIAHARTTFNADPALRASVWHYHEDLTGASTFGQSIRRLYDRIAGGASEP